MFDIWIGDVEITTLVLIFSVAVLLPIQLLLCFKVRSKAARLLPISVLFISAVVSAAVSAAVMGWKRLGYVFLAIFTGFMSLICVIGWGYGQLSNLRKRKVTENRRREQMLAI